MSYIMNLHQLINDTRYSVRTQISLSPSLYRALKEKAKEADKSLAAVIRDSILSYIKYEEQKEKESKETLHQLTEEIRKIRESGNSGWAKVKDPYKLIRKWRQEEEEQ